MCAYVHERACHIHSVCTVHDIAHIAHECQSLHRMFVLHFTLTWWLDSEVGCCSSISPRPPPPPLSLPPSKLPHSSPFSHLFFFLRAVSSARLQVSPAVLPVLKWFALPKLLHAPPAASRLSFLAVPLTDSVSPAKMSNCGHQSTRDGFLRKASA